MNVCMVLHKYSVPIDDPCCYPLGYMYVSSFLKACGHNVKILNYNLHDYDFEKEISGQELVTFTGFEEFRERIKRDAQICKAHGIKTIVGGALATFRPKEMKECCDHVHTGYIDHAGIMPDYDGFGIEEYHRIHDIRYMGVLTSFGCPYHCTFCAHTGAFLPRRVDDVSCEIIHYIIKYKMSMVVFYDNTFNFSKNRFMTMCHKLRNYGLAWCAAIRADIFDDQMAKAAKESGCKYFVVGVESFRQDKLNRMHKELSVESITNCLDLLHKYDINYHGNVLVGLEGESYDYIMEEIDEIPKKYNIFPTLVQPFIGTHDGFRRNLSDNEYAALSKELTEYVESKGYYQYQVSGIS